jgi:drug/metabolite transporter (DMT)-like permease
MTTSAQPAVSPAKATSFLVLTTLLWGGSFVFNKIAFREIPPVTFMFLRFALATAIMALFCLRRLPGLNRDIIVKGTKVGLALAAANLTFVLGVAGTSVSRAGFLNNLFVLLIPLLCYLRWRERISRWNLVAVLIALAGLWQLASGGAAGFSRGDLLSTVCALFISLHIVLVSRVLNHEDVYLVTLVQFAAVALVGALLFVCLPGKPLAIGPVSAGALLYCAVFPTVCCFTLQNTYQRYTTPSRAGLIYTLDPVWSLLGGTLILGERLSPGEWLGCSFIFAAVLLPLLIHLIQQRRAPDYLHQRA